MHSSTNKLLLRRLSMSCVPRAKSKPQKKVHWASLQKRKTNCDRALEHFDDFYTSVYGEKKWASLRLALLSSQKYAAVPNPFTGNIDQITSKLESMGGHSLHKMWQDGKEHLLKEKKVVDLKKDLGRIHQLEKALESIAVTKKAEEMEVIYQNAPDKEGNLGGEGREGFFRSRVDQREDRRVFVDPSEAAFVPPSRLKGVDDFAFDSEYYSGFLPSSNAMTDADDSIPFTNATTSKKLTFPKYLQPYCFEPGSGQEFPGAARDPSSGLREYLCVNGASIAPILALDLHPEANLLDLCSGPGTKALMAFMTLSLQSITCNDVDQGRLFRVKKIFQEFVGTKTPPTVQFTRHSAVDYPTTPTFSRILADVPCLSDRTACTTPDNSIFKPTRAKERLNLVRVQKSILLSGLKAMSTEEGSATVYSTCTLSPVENDGVVMQALRETDVGNLAVDLYGVLEVLRPFERLGVFRLSRTRFGVVVEPWVFCNFGPMFVCRIVVRGVGSRDDGGVLGGGLS